MNNTDGDRLKAIRQIRINYPQANEILEKIRYCHQASPDYAEPKCMLITGFQGVGKTTLFQSYLAAHPRLETDDGTNVPVLGAVIPAPATVKSLVTALLLALGDPAADKGSLVQQTIRLRHLLKECRTEVIFLDEFQHIIDRDSERVLQNTADWLKNLLNETKIPLVLFGMPSCVTILDANPQLRRRFTVRRQINPFEWSKDPKKSNSMRLLLNVIEQKLSLKKPSNLSDPETAYRIYCSTLGIIDSIMKLVRGAAERAIETGEERITTQMLSEVYEEELAVNAPEAPNPFSTALSEVTPLITEPDAEYSRRRKRR